MVSWEKMSWSKVDYDVAWCLVLGETTTSIGEQNSDDKLKETRKLVASIEL
jgi:hypothetical protein